MFYLLTFEMANSYDEKYISKFQKEKNLSQLLIHQTIVLNRNIYVYIY